MIRLHLIRHAEEQPDRPNLTRQALEDCDALSDRLAQWQPSRIFTSPAARARETASRLFGPREVDIDPRLDEMVDVPGIPPRQRTTDHDSPESWHQVLSRVECFLDHLRPDEAEVAAVTHSGVFDAMHDVLSGSAAAERIELSTDHLHVTSWDLDRRPPRVAVLLAHNASNPYGIGDWR